MKNIFSKIIILIIVFVSIPAIAQSANCTNTGGGYSCSGSYPQSANSGNIGVYVPPPAIPGGGVSSGEAAARAAAEKAGRVAACKAVKEGVPNDVRDCRAEVNYKQSIMSGSCMNNASGYFEWRFSYSGGRYLSLDVTLPTQAYNNNLSGSPDCRYLANASGDLTRSKCETQGAWIINTVCKDL